MIAHLLSLINMQYMVLTACCYPGNIKFTYLQSLIFFFMYETTE